MGLSGCSAGSGTTHARTTVAAVSTSSADATATAAASPTADPLGGEQADGQRIYNTVKHLAVDIGPRVAGTAGEAMARDYLEAMLRSYGYEVSEQAFAFDASAYLPARVDAGADAFPAIAFRGSAAGAVKGRIVAAGNGRRAEIPAEVRGTIALIRRGDVLFNDMVQNAMAAGATAVIIYNNVPGSLIADVAAAPIPVVGLAQQAGQAIAERAAAGAMEGGVTVSPPRGTAYNVIARPKGASACTTVTGGHYDSVAVTGGADDNASGAAAVIEVARMAAARKLAGDNCFVLFSGEEIGLFGSQAFVEQLSPDALVRLRGMLNLDVVGMSTPLELVGDAGIVEQARVEGQRAGVGATPAVLPVGASSDHASFEAKGVPVVMFTRADNLIHTQRDAMGRVGATALRDAATIAYATLASLAR